MCVCDNEKLGPVVRIQMRVQVHIWCTANLSTLVRENGGDGGVCQQLFAVDMGSSPTRIICATAHDLLQMIKTYRLVSDRTNDKPGKILIRSEPYLVLVT